MKIVVFPEPGYEGDKIWTDIPYAGLRNTLEAKGFTVESYNMNPASVDISHDVGLYCGLPSYPCPTTTRSLCVQLEPPIVPNRARFYERMGGLPFTRIITFVKGYVDDKRVFYDVMPIVPYQGEYAPKRDKYICAVSGGGKEFPSVTIDGITYESLFAARRMAYMGFGKDLDLYGRGWEKDIEMINSVNYLGPCENKIKTMSQYRKAIVFENTNNCYTSEKYWDAIMAGIKDPDYRGQWPEYDINFADYRNWAERITKHIEAIL